MAHVEIIEKNFETLSRCIHINVHLVAGLRAEGVIDDAIESRLKAEKVHHDKLRLLIVWIKDNPGQIYESFLQVMERNDQQHVANLLRGKEHDNHVPLSIARYDRLMKIRLELMYMIHNNVVLIAALRGLKAISQTDEQDLRIGNVPNYKKNYRLLNAVLRRSDYSFDCLHDALRDTHQTDAADYLMQGEVIRVTTPLPPVDEGMEGTITGEVIRVTTPLPPVDEGPRLQSGTVEEYTGPLEGQSTTLKIGEIYQNPNRPRSPQVMEERLERHREFLVDRIDPDFGLLDKLRASGTLAREAIHKIKLKDNTTEDKSRILLDFILKDKKPDELFSALADSGQNHLVNYLNADGVYMLTFGDDWPLSETEICRLNINHGSLVDILDTSDLCIRLFSEGVINNRQIQFISSKPTDAEKNEALLDILTKCSLRQYKKTIDCLLGSHQSFIANLLSYGGVLVRVHAKHEGAIGNADEQEEEIITQLTRVLEDRPVEEATRIFELTQKRIRAARK